MHESRRDRAHGHAGEHANDRRYGGLGPDRNRAGLEYLPTPDGNRCSVRLGDIEGFILNPSFPRMRASYWLGCHVLRNSGSPLRDARHDDQGTCVSSYRLRTVLNPDKAPLLFANQPVAALFHAHRRSGSGS